MADERTYLSVLFDHFPTGVMVADDRAYYVDVNQVACELLGRSRDLIIGHHLSAIIAPGRMAEVDLQWQAFLRDGSQQGIVDVAMTDGTTRALQFNARANFAPGLHCSFLSPVTARETGGSVPNDLLAICAWSKRVRYDGQWVGLEQYLLQAHGLSVTHGISPQAFAEINRTTKPK